ncbi:universal stress protein [Actinocrispum wychmicini]|uniref:Nucleotide-binding universal stress UspA family protein n=1 Tax=Actinocrispum wychmicini TaxID=1213861 RepID=A0A4R2JR53_9PSEU|nr:universal stress protein [Actinocrispum wychmicini]TCO61954.1 nucleotide-binding universal stress UspA family protein [Actinocrispum wychmicini]
MNTLSHHRRPVVVGVDGSSAALAAVRWAAGEAALHRLPLTLTHVQHDPTGRYPDQTIEDAMRPALHAQAEKWLRGNAQLIVVGSRGLGGYHGMLLGSTSQALVNYAQCPLAVIRPRTSS